MGTPEQTELSTALESATRRDFVVDLLTDDWGKRSFNPFDNPTKTEELLAQRLNWRDGDGVTTVLTSGAYDLVHLDHLAYLLDAKLQGAPNHYERRGRKAGQPKWEDLDVETREALMMDFLRAGALKLIVSVDGNDKVAERKSGKPDKGNTTRPILDWQTRSRLLECLSLQLGNGDRHPLVDAVTINDPVAGHGTPHQNMFEQAAFLQPEVWAAYHESTYIFDGAPFDPRLSTIELRKINDTDRFLDKLIGTFSTTKITERLTS